MKEIIWKMISEELCDIEELSNDADNSAVQYQVKITF